MCAGTFTSDFGQKEAREAREEARAATGKAEETISEEAAMIHQIGDVEIEVVCHSTDSRLGLVNDNRGRSRTEVTPMHRATVVGQGGLWARGRSPAEAIGNVILSWPEAFAAHPPLNLPRSKEFFVPPIKSR